MASKKEEKKTEKKQEEKNENVIVLEPVVSEKSYAMANELNKYQFFVPKGMNKIEVKKAIEKQYGVKVTNVNTVVKPGKGFRNWETRVRYRKSDRRKAIVTLKDGDKIDEFFNI